LAEDGFRDVEQFALHATLDGDFPNVPGHVSNPENPAVFDAIITRAQEVGAEFVLATDPDCDRVGCAVPETLAKGSKWRTLTGNQIGALLTDYVLEKKAKSAGLSAEHYVVKTLVTTEMIARIAESYGVTCEGNLHVGFKWIAGLMDAKGPRYFVFGAEESHGYQVGTYTRDKDAAVASMLLAELAAHVKAQGKSLCEKLDDLYWQHGCHAERTVSVTMPGSEGMQRMVELMARFRQSPPATLGGLKIDRQRDYLNLTIRSAGSSIPLNGPKGDMVMLDLAARGNYVAIRPSGTEPKVKFYMFAFEPAEQLADLEGAKRMLETRLDAIESDLREFALVG
jgi:phosphoglucomutase/phosphomannomutase